MGAAPSPSQHDPRLCVCRAGTAPPRAHLHGMSLPVQPDRQQGSGQRSPASPWGPARVALCRDLSSALASPPGWKGEDSPAGVCPRPGRQRGALSPRWDVSGPRGCPHPSPGTVGWRRRGRHWRRATPNPPAAQGKEQRDGSGGDRLLPRALLPQRQTQPGASCHGWSLEPPSLRRTPRGCTVPGGGSSRWGSGGKRCSLPARRPGSPRARRCPTSASAPWT